MRDPRRRLRVALYSHDAVGLGHMRRNLLIAQTLIRSPLQPVVLMIAGAREASLLPIPDEVDCLILPGLQKDPLGHYRSRHLDIALDELIALRARTILAGVEAFDPDVLIVDKVPRGALRELDVTLQSLRASGRARCVLGLRDILDQPAAVDREWSSAANVDAIRTYYDAVWVYGDPAVYDLVNEYHFPVEVAAKVHHTGYLGHRSLARYGDGRPFSSAPLVPEGRIILCLVGGGEDGAELAKAFVHAELPTETQGVILTGPMMPRDLQQEVRDAAAANRRLSVFEFVRDPDSLLRRAERVVAMGGYNTVCEVLSLAKHALIVPRVNPRCEQLIRAERLRGLGLVDVLHPDGLTPQALSEWLAHDLGDPLEAGAQIDLDGLDRLPLFLEEVLQSSLAVDEVPLEGRLRDVV